MRRRHCFVGLSCFSKNTYLSSNVPFQTNLVFELSNEHASEHHADLQRYYETENKDHYRKKQKEVSRFLNRKVCPLKITKIPGKIFEDTNIFVHFTLFATYSYIRLIKDTVEQMLHQEVYLFYEVLNVFLLRDCLTAKLESPSVLLECTCSQNQSIVSILISEKSEEACPFT